MGGGEGVQSASTLSHWDASQGNNETEKKTGQCLDLSGETSRPSRVQKVITMETGGKYKGFHMDLWMLYSLM